MYMICGLINPVSAQQQLLKNYTINDGLVSNSIRRVYQDAKGFLWIATLEGLSKYDGHSFTNYSTANGLSHNVVNALYEDEDQRLYVALNNGAIDILSGNQVIPETRPAQAVINQFLKLPTGVILVSTDRNGVQQFADGKPGILKKLPSKQTFSDILLYNDSLIIALEESSVKVLNTNYELLAEIGDAKIIDLNSTIYQDSKKRIWVSTVTGLQLMEFSQQKKGSIVLSSPPVFFNIPILKGKIIRDIFEDAEGIMWFATTGGVIKIDPDQTHQLITIKDGLPSNIVNSIFQDKEKNLWFGTAAGLSKLVTRQSITLYPMKDAFYENDYSYLLHPFKKNHVLVGTYKGTKVFNTLTESFTAVSNNGNQIFFDVVTNSNPTLLAGHYNLAIFDTAGIKYKKIIPLPLQLSSKIIYDKKGNFFLHNGGNLHFISGKTLQKIINHRITALLIDRRGDLWAATWQDGLFRIKYDFSNDKLTIIATHHFLPAEDIRSLFEDSKGNIWVGTRYQGVYQLSKKENDSFAIVNLDQKKGLTSNFIKGIREDANGNYWIAFYLGLDKLIVSGNSFRIFNFSRVNNYFTTIIGMETDDEHILWLATNDGLVKIKDGEMEKVPPLPVYITKVFSPDSNYSLTKSNLQLKYRQNRLQFEFSSPGFINEKQLLYSYRLKGNNNTEWSKASNQNIVSYASLQPGHYIFEVRTQGWNGNWGPASAFEFVIAPPFWQTWWFLALSSLLLFAIIFWIVRKRVGTIRTKADLKQKIAETEMMALRAQMNPHFIFNCINSIDALIQGNDKYQATVYLNKFAKLIRNILDNSKHNTVTLAKDLDTLKLYIELEQLRHENKFSAELIFDKDLLQDDYKVPPLIVQPFVENAILHGLKNKYGNEGILTIEVSIKDNMIQYMITDNGIGREAAGKIVQNKESHLGMQMSYDRIRLFNKEEMASVKIKDLYRDQQATGTAVTVNLKII
ncbi:MAG: two-component regulator propeller domain-containing protein [Ferruginibacter sp.]